MAMSIQTDTATRVGVLTATEEMFDPNMLFDPILTATGSLNRS